METRFFKVTSYVEVFVPADMTSKEIKEQAEDKVRDHNDMFMDNISVDLEAVDAPFELMSESFRMAVELFEEFDKDECIRWYEKARFNVEVCK
jgi:hypothetical protein